MNDSRLQNLPSDFRDFFEFENLSRQRSRESGVGKARESESGDGVGNSVNRLPSPE